MDFERKPSLIVEELLLPKTKKSSTNAGRKSQKLKYES